MFVKVVCSIGFVLALSGCGSSGASAGACSSSPILGTFRGTILGQTDTMVISDACTITSSYCQSTSTYPVGAIATSGSITITVTSTSGITGCLPVGATTCAYSLVASSLSYNCGGSTITYTKQ